MAEPDQTRPTDAASQTARAKGPAKLGVYDRPAKPLWARPLPILIVVAVIIALIIVFWAINASAGGQVVAMTAAAALPPRGLHPWPTRASSRSTTTSPTRRKPCATWKAPASRGATSA